MQASASAFKTRLPRQQLSRANQRVHPQNPPRNEVFILHSLSRAACTYPRARVNANTSCAGREEEAVVKTDDAFFSPEALAPAPKEVGYSAACLFCLGCLLYQSIVFACARRTGALARVLFSRSPWRAHVACAPRLRQCLSFSRMLLSLSRIE
jgi:hypothetical protein